MVWGFVVWLRASRRRAPSRELRARSRHERARSVRLDTVERAIADIAAGKAVVVVDDEDRENEGDLIFAASQGDAGADGVHDPHTSGVICVPMPADDARPARDPADDAAQPGPDAHGVHDLGRRPRRRHAPASAPPTARTPCGCWPTRPPSRGSSPGPGTCSRCATARAACWCGRGHTEAAVDLARLAGLTPAGVLVEIVNDDGTMKRGQQLRDVRRRARAGDDLDRADWSATAAATRTTSSGSPRPGCRPAHGDFTAYGYRITIDGSEHVALVYGDLAGAAATSRC